MYSGQFRIEAGSQLARVPFPGPPQGPPSYPGYQIPPRESTPPRQYSQTFADNSPVFNQSIGANGYPRPGSNGYLKPDQTIPRATAAIDTENDGIPNLYVSGPDLNRDGVPDFLQRKALGSSPYSSPYKLDTSADDIQRQRLMHGLQEVSEAALRADRIATEAYNARNSAKDKLRDLEERAELAESRLLQAQKSAAHHRNMYREELSAKEAAESRARRTEGLKSTAENRLRILERDSSSMRSEKNMCDELMDQIAQLQLRLQEVEAENTSLRAAQTLYLKERNFLSEQIRILEQSSNGWQSGPLRAAMDRERDGDRRRNNMNRAGNFEDDLSPNRHGQHLRDLDRSRYGDRDRDGRHGDQRRNFGRNGNDWSGYSDEDDACLASKPHRMPEPPHAPDEDLICASSPPQGRPGKVHVEADEVLKHRRLAGGIDLILPSRDPSRREIEYRVMNKKLTILDFSAELTHHDNCSWRENPQSPTRVIKLKPGEEAIVGTVVKQSKAARFGLKFHWTTKPAPPLRDRSSGSTEQPLDSLEAEMRDHGILVSKLGSADAIMSACKRYGVNQFLDVEFLPNNKALFAKPNDSTNPQVVWKRPRDFLKGPVKLFNDRCDPQPSDILQGALGDCWFLAALAAMAEYPDLVKAVFSKAMVNEYGVYELVCYKNGQTQSIIIDDMFPCVPDTGVPCYSHTKTDEIWVLLLEKAWAKLHGSYATIEGGLPYRAIMDLTGNTGTCISLKDENPEKLWARLLRYDKLGYLMCAATPGEDQLTKATKRPSAGIVPGHAYTLRGVKEAEGQRLLNLRNPWGQFEWDGDWSDNSPLWTEKMRRAFKYRSDANDGCFWMDEKDFLSHYDAVNVDYTCCSNGDAWNASRNSFDLSGDDVNKSCLFFTIRQKTSGYFTLLQHDERIINTPDYIELGFGVYGPLDSHDGITEIVRSPCWNTREIVQEVLEDHPIGPGKYAVVVFNPSKVHDRSFAILLHLDSNQKQSRSGQEIPTEVDDLSASLWDDIALAIATKSAGAQSQKLGPVETSGNWMPNGGYVLAAKSVTGGKSSVEWDFTQCVGLRVAGSRGNSSKVSVQVNPGEFQLIAKLLPTATKGEKKLGFSISFS